MLTAAQTLLSLTDLLLDASQSPGVLREAAQQWYRWGLVTGNLGDEQNLLPHDPLLADQRLPSGTAISLLGAARCVLEYQRTAVFLRAMAAALRAARERFPGETIHVLEAGCGPLAPLTLPFALRYPPEQVVFTLLDIHPASLACAERLAKELGVRESMRGFVTADAAKIKFDEPNRPHVIACEVMLEALRKEPQVAVTMNLAPQLRPGGFFLPERIDVDAALFDSHEHFLPPAEGMTAAEITARGFTGLGPVFTLEAARATELQAQEGNLLPAGTVRMPPHNPAQSRLHLTTRIQVFGGHTLGNFDSSLNLPQRVKHPRELAENGGEFKFVYELSSTPGLRVRSAK